MSTQTRSRTTTRADDKSRQTTTTVRPPCPAPDSVVARLLTAPAVGEALSDPRSKKIGTGPDDGAVCSDDTIFSTHLEGCNYKFIIS